MKYLIWGAGDRGKRVFYSIGAENVVAFIDVNKEKIGKTYLGKKILSLDEVKQNNLKHCIVISPRRYENEIAEELEANGIDYYLSLKECPGDLQDPYPRDYFKNYILTQIKPDLRYIVYGSTLYSLMLFEWVKEKSIHCPFLLLSENTNDGLIKLLKQEWKDFVVTELPDSVQYDIIFDTKRKSLTKMQCEKCNIDFLKKRDIFDCAVNIEEYYNEEICRFKNIHKGKRCFIIGLGPSLMIEDLDRLYNHQEICISMNTIWKAFDKTKWRPTYYVADDYRVIRGDCGDMLEHMKNSYCFIGDTDPQFCEKMDRPSYVFLHHANQEISEDMPSKFSGDFSRNCYTNSTVTNSCLQLAAYMGFKEIYLLGVDFSYGSSKYETYKHFYKEDNKNSLGFRDAVYMGYLGAKKYADEHGIKICNATRGGKLEVFERVDFDELFDIR